MTLKGQIKVMHYSHYGGPYLPNSCRYVLVYDLRYDIQGRYQSVIMTYKTIFRLKGLTLSKEVRNFSVKARKVTGKARNI